MKRFLFLLIILLSTLGAQAEVWFAQIDSCAILSAVVSTPLTTSVCEGDSIELSATVYPSVSAQWYKDGQPFGMPNAETVYATQSGVYHLEVTNALLQCSHSYDDIPLQINPLPVVYAGEDFTVCAGAYVEFFASGALDYVWSNGVSDTYGTLVYESGAISVIGANALGCSNSDTLMATVSPSVIYFYDADGDGFGDLNFPGAFCAQPPSFVTNSNDCNDSNFSVNENASELCNNIDDDCDNLVDEGFNLSNYFIDLDSDGFGNANSNIIACFQPIGYVSNATDCNDDDFIINTNAPEICNDLDENCNGLVDDGLVFINYYVDFDSDGFGSSNTMQNTCYQPAGFVANALDCNDASFCVNAAAIEICNGLDDDCNGVADNGIVFATFYADVDGDTYGDPATGQDFCLIPTELFVANGSDCDDANALVNPAAIEIWENGTDDDCNPNTSDVSVGELSAFAFNLFPNPVADRITLTMSSSDVRAVELYNSLGQLIHTSKIFGTQVSIDVSEFPKGYYVVRVNGLSKTFVKNN
ncbi:MAG: MopE-related protein [Sediminibacterium sp.]